MSVQHSRDVENVPNVAKMCETIPSDNDRRDWEANGKEVTIVPSSYVTTAYDAPMTQWISAKESDLEFLEDNR